MLASACHPVTPVYACCPMIVHRCPSPDKGQPGAKHRATTNNSEEGGQEHQQGGESYSCNRLKSSG